MPARSAVKAAVGAAGHPAEPISQRALNRALLDRQLLLQRSSTRAVDAIDHLVGMQAQVPLHPYFGLWSRLDAFDPSELAELISQRLVVRIALMRNTVHLVTAADCLTLRPLIQPNRKEGTAALQIRLLEPLPVQARDAVCDEGERLLSFAAADAADHDIQLTATE